MCEGLHATRCRTYAPVGPLTRCSPKLSAPTSGWRTRGSSSKLWPLGCAERGARRRVRNTAWGQSKLAKLSASAPGPFRRSKAGTQASASNPNAQMKLHSSRRCIMLAVRIGGQRVFLKSCTEGSGSVNLNAMSRTWKRPKTRAAAAICGGTEPPDIGHH